MPSGARFAGHRSTAAPSRAARSGSTTCSQAWPGAVGERARRPQHHVAARPQRRQPRAQLARPALHAAQLGPRRGACVDREAVAHACIIAGEPPARHRAADAYCLMVAMHRRSGAPMRRRLLRRPAASELIARSRSRPGPGAASSCATSSSPTARRSSRWSARAATSTGRGRTRPSGRTSSTTSSHAPAATTSPAWRPCSRRRRAGRDLHDLADRSRLLPVGLPRLLRERPPRRARG